MTEQWYKRFTRASIYSLPYASLAMDKNYYAALLKEFMDGPVSEARRQELFEALNREEWAEDWKDVIASLSLEAAPDLSYRESDWDSFIDEIIHPSGQIRPVPVLPARIRMISRKWMAYAAAVAVIISVGFFVWKNAAQEPAREDIIAKTVTTDILPGSNKATLTLGDGHTIILDRAANGSLAAQGNTRIIKLNEGSLSYTINSGDQPTAATLYNTINTPRGGQYQVILPDGSKVWLNAASSLRFPTQFTGGSRTVEVTGEAYFEIAKNKDLPFIVNVNNAAIKVLGTHFNVMAYNDEELLKTTLLEGSVEFINASTHQVMKPGEQMQLSKIGRAQLITGVDTGAVIAWKEGVFHFEKASMETVMRQLARWYDVEVIYERKTSADDLFYADIPRNNKLSDVLKALKIAGGIQFELEGKTIIVR